MLSVIDWRGPCIALSDDDDGSSEIMVGMFEAESGGLVYSEVSR